MSEGVQGEYVELAVTTNCTFCTGASHGEEYVERAADLGMSHIGITDHDSVGGVVRAHSAGLRNAVRVLPGARLCMEGFDVLVYPESRRGWGNLCRVLTLGKRRAAKGCCQVHLDELLEHHHGLLAIALVPPCTVRLDPFDPGWVKRSMRLAEALGRGEDRLSLGIVRHAGGRDRESMDLWQALSRDIGAPLVACNDVRVHEPGRRRLLDVLTCVREHCTIDEAGRRLHANVECHLKSARAMAALFADCPEAIARTLKIARRASAFSLDALRYEYPQEICPEGMDEDDYLSQLVEEGVADRYPEGLPESVRAQLTHERELIAELKYAPYFLTVFDLVRFARSRGILCQGRGAAANSAVCFVLGLTAVDPARSSLLFERFVSRERQEPPDIDIDFEHERREEVIQYIYRRWGREHAALTATTITWRWRSAIRDVGRVLGLDGALIDALARDAEISIEGTRAKMACDLARSLKDLSFPRHRSQHVGGFVITRGPLCELVPIENAAMDGRTVIEWDKDDIEALGILKVDVLGLGMLTCIRRCLEMVEAKVESRKSSVERRSEVERRLQLHTIPPEDPAVYDMCCRADTVGVFQIESRAQMAMLPRLRPRCFYDLVIEIALVRPGPIQGGMVHPYLRRREGREPVTYPDEAVRHVLERTLGVPLFQEQAMALAMVAGGFSAGEADDLRRAMAAWKRRGNDMRRMGVRLVAGMRSRGYDEAFIQRCWRQIHGFSEYGFPESHAASFAVLVYASAWLRCHHPAPWAASLINSQPMGFYAPAQIVADAKGHGVAVRAVDVNHSAVGCTVEDGDALRLGLQLVRGLSREDAAALVAARLVGGSFGSVHELARRSGLGPGVLRRLARADAFESMELDRQETLWAIQEEERGQLPLFDSCELRGEGEATGVSLPVMAPSRQVVLDYCATGLSLKAHPMSFVRSWLDAHGVEPTCALEDEERFEDRASVSLAGLVLVRQRPHTARGMTFMTLEDETGTANIVIAPRIYERCRRVVRGSGAVLVRGRVQRSSGGALVHLRAGSLASIDDRVGVANPIYEWA